MRGTVFTVFEHLFERVSRCSMAGGMGGGWGKRGGGVPLHERVRGDQVGAAAYDARQPVGADCPARHCWVSGAVDAEGVKRPGLLFEWRQVRGRWEGRVAYAARLRPLEANGGWLMVEEWLPAELLTPL